MNAIEPLYADCYFFRDRDGDNAMLECVTLQPPEPGLNLALGQIVDRVQYRNLVKRKQQGQCISKNVQMSVDNIRPTFFENRWQSVVHAVIESGPLAQIAYFYPGILEQTIEVATQPASIRNHYRLVTLAVQSPRDMNRYALGAPRAQHRNNMNDPNLLHDLN
jgi:hypothetical protein